MVILQDKLDEARSVCWGGRDLPANEAAQLVVHVCCRRAVLAGNMKSAAPLAIEGMQVIEVLVWRKDGLRRHLRLAPGRGPGTRGRTREDASRPRGLLQSRTTAQELDRHQLDCGSTLGR